MTMQWSKTKSTLERFLCEKLKGRIELHATVYRKFHDSPSRVWITLDRREILSASDVTYAVQHGKLYEQLKVQNQLKPMPYDDDWKVMFHSPERQALVQAPDVAENRLIDQGIFKSYHLYDPLMQYSSLSIEEALNADNVIVRAYSMLDRRLGKRRLKKLHFPEDTHPLIIDFYKIRCEVEGIVLS